MYTWQFKGSRINVRVSFSRLQNSHVPNFGTMVPGGNKWSQTPLVGVTLYWRLNLKQASLHKLHLYRYFHLSPEKFIPEYRNLTLQLNLDLLNCDMFLPFLLWQVIMKSPWNRTNLFPSNQGRWSQLGPPEPLGWLTTPPEGFLNYGRIDIMLNSDIYPPEKKRITYPMPCQNTFELMSFRTCRERWDMDSLHGGYIFKSFMFQGSHWTVMKAMELAG